MLLCIVLYMAMLSGDLIIVSAFFTYHYEPVLSHTRVNIDLIVAHFYMTNGSQVIISREVHTSTFSGNPDGMILLLSMS